MRPSPRGRRFAVHFGQWRLRVTGAAPSDHDTVGRLVTPTRLVLGFSRIMLHRNMKFL